MSSEDKEKKRLDRKVKRQNRLIIILGILMVVIYLVIAYIFRGSRFPLPSPF